MKQIKISNSYALPLRVGGRASRISFLFSLIVCTVLSSPVIEAQQNKMYWTDIGTNKIQRADLDGSNVEDIVTGLESPHGIALDLTNNKIYWTDHHTQKIQRANLDGSNIEDLVTSLPRPDGIALDLINGKMYWTESLTDTIQRANLDGSNIETLVTNRSARSIALDPTNREMYWIDWPASIHRADLDGRNIEDLVDTEFSGPWSIALDLINGKIYWTNYHTQKIQRADLNGGNIEDLITTLRGPVGIALDLINGKIYWAISGLTDKIQRADLNGSNIEDIVTGLSDPGYIALDVENIPPPPPSVTLDITADPNPAQIGNPLNILLDVANPGVGFDAEFRLWAIANDNVTPLVSISPFVAAGLVIDDFAVFSTNSVPAGLPPVVGFLAAIFDDDSGERMDSDFEVVGIGVAPAKAQVSALRQVAPDFLDSGGVNAAPPLEGVDVFNGTVSNPWQEVSAKGKLTTTWGRIKGQR